jgi:hypothetical protein
VLSAWLPLFLFEPRKSTINDRPDKIDCSEGERKKITRSGESAISVSEREIVEN